MGEGEKRKPFPIFPQKRLILRLRFYELKNLSDIWASDTSRPSEEVTKDRPLRAEEEGRNWVNSVQAFSVERRQVRLCEHELYPIARLVAGKTRKKMASSAGYSMVFFWVKYSLSHAQIGLPFHFNFYLPRSLPVTLIWEPPPRPSPQPPTPPPPPHPGGERKSQ